MRWPKNHVVEQSDGFRCFALEHNPYCTGRRRVYQHQQKLIEGFTSKYHIVTLVYFEETPDVKAAIAREKRLKGWTRAKKVELIEAENPQWSDLSKGW
jgi:putative endonuclease